jgi:ABC-type branched-subunit amino acid transport system substrate-binding protein
MVVISFAIARRWITQEGVDAVVDVAGSSNAFAVGEIACGTKVAVLVSGATVAAR